MNARSVALSALSGGALAAGAAGCGGAAKAPADAATKLVPAGALVYVHVSTDTGRAGTKDALKLARRFDGYAGAVRSVVSRFGGAGCKLDLGHGKEAALALLDTGGTQAGSLVLVDTGTKKPAPAQSCGGVQAQKIGSFEAIGQAETLRAARQLSAGKGRSLADDPAYAKALGQLPKDRVADAWVTRDGVRRLLSPQGGLLGVTGALLNSPTLTSAAAAVRADGTKRAELTLVSQLSAPGPGGFRPTLQDTAPAGVTAFLSTQGLGGSLGRLLPLALPQTQGLAPLLARAAGALAPVSRLFSGEVGVTLVKAIPAPILTLFTRTNDPAAASAALARARPTIARLLKPSGGATPVWHHVADGILQLKPASGIELDYAVAKGQVVVSTRTAGVESQRAKLKPLSGTGVFTRAEPQIPDRVSSLTFLDFSQLLSLGEQTGLNDSRAYLAVKDDLQRVRSVGARTSSDGNQSTAELSLSIP